MLKVTLITGGRSTGFYTFTAESDTPIDAEHACIEQRKQGYHSGGYGFYKFESGFDGTKFVATWKCSTSCD